MNTADCYIENHYQGYSLMELLIVMAIMIVIGGYSAVNIPQMRQAMAVTNSVSMIKQDIRLAKRSSMLLSREKGERWPYGIGIDFSAVDTTGTYRLFKWCSPYNEYDRNIVQLSSELPGYSPSVPTGVNMPVGTMTNDEGKCLQGSTSTNVLVAIPGNDGLKSRKVDNYVKIGFGDSPVRYVLFESVTGRVFMYDGNGNLLNYLYSGTSVSLSSTLSLDIIISKSDETGQELILAPISGVLKQNSYSSNNMVASPTFASKPTIDDLIIDE